MELIDRIGDKTRTDTANMKEQKKNTHTPLKVGAKNKNKK